MNARTPITVKQAAEMLGVSGGRVRNLFKVGALRGYNDGCVRIYRESVEAHIAAHENSPPAPVDAAGSDGADAMPAGEPSVRPTATPRRRGAHHFVHLRPQL